MASESGPSPESSRSEAARSVFDSLVIPAFGMGHPRGRLLPFDLVRMQAVFHRIRKHCAAQGVEPFEALASKILKLAAEQGEVQVDEALRELLEGKAETAITVESIGELLANLDTIAPVTMVEVASVDLASFDQLCLDREVLQ